MSNDTLAIANKYIAAWRDKDAAGLRELVHEDIRSKGPTFEVQGREDFLESFRRLLPVMVEFRLRSLFINANQAIFVYDFVCPEPIGVSRVAEMIAIDGGRVKEVELFYDPRPFLQAAQSANQKP